MRFHTCKYTHAAHESTHTHSKHRVHAAAAGQRSRLTSINLQNVRSHYFWLCYGTFARISHRTHTHTQSHMCSGLLSHARGMQSSNEDEGDAHDDDDNSAGLETLHVPFSRAPTQQDARTCPTNARAHARTTNLRIKRPPRLAAMPEVPNKTLRDTKPQPHTHIGILMRHSTDTYAGADSCVCVCVCARSRNRNCICCTPTDMVCAGAIR